MKKLKWIFIGAIALFVLVVAIVAIAVLSYDYNKLKPEISKAALDATGRHLSIDGDIKLKFGLTPALQINGIRFENASWGSRKDLAKVKTVEVSVALLPLLRKKISVKRFHVISPDIIVETNAAGKSNLEFDVPKKAEPKAEKKADKKAEKKEPFSMPDVSLDDVRIENGDFLYKDVRTNASYSVKLKELKISTPMLIEAMSIKIKGAFGDKPFEASTKFKVTGGNVFTLSDLDASFAGSDVSGSIEASLAGVRPRLKADIKSKKIDIAALTAKETKKEDAKAAPSGEGSKYLFPREALPMDALKQADADLKVSAGAIVLPGITIREAKLDLKLKDGSLNISPLKAKVGGGTISSDISLSPKGKAGVLAVKVNGSKVDVGQIVKDLGVTDLYEGNVDANVDIKGEGESVAAIMASLNGKLDINAGKGKINNKYLDKGGEALKTVLMLLNPGAASKEYTTLNCAVVGFDIKGGIAKSTAIVVNTDLAGIVGGGTADLRTEKLDFKMQAIDKTKALKVGGVGLSDVAKSFKVEGRLAKPSVGIDAASAVSAIGKAFGGKKMGGFEELLGGGSGGAEVTDSCEKAVSAAKKGVAAEPAKAAPSASKVIKKKADEEINKNIDKGLKKLFGR